MSLPPSNVRFRILGLLMAYAGLCHFNRIGISAAGSEHIIQETGISETEMGWVYTAYLVVYTCCMMPGGWLIDRAGPKRALLMMGLGSAVLVPLTGAASLAPTGGGLLVALIIIRGLLGVVSAPLHPGAARAVSFWFPVAARSAANGLVTGAAVAGVAVTYYLFGFMMDLFTWPWAFAVSGLVTLALAAAWAMYGTDRPGQHRDVNAAELALIDEGDPLLRRDAAGAASAAHDATRSSGEPRRLPRDAGDSSAVPWRALLRDRSMLLLTASYAMASYFQYLFFYWVQYYFDKVLLLGKSDARLYATIPTVGMALGMICGGWLADRAELRYPGWAGRAITPMVSMVASALLLGLGILGGPPGWVVACFALAMAALGASESSFWVTGIELGRHRGGLSAAMLNTGGNAGGLLAPVITPWFSQYFGWQAGLAVAGLLCLVGAGMWCGIEPATRERLEGSPGREAA